MKKYTVILTYAIQREVVVDAKDETEAKLKAENDFLNEPGDINLNDNECFDSLVSSYVNGTVKL